MAERTNFYDSMDTLETSTSTTFVDVPNIVITGLKASTKYLIRARVLWGSGDAGDIAHLRVETPDDTLIEAKSEAEWESDSESDFYVYRFDHSFTTAATPSEVHLQFRIDATHNSTVKVDQASLWLLDLDEIGVEGTDYYEDIHADPGEDVTEFTPQNGTNGRAMAQLLGTTLPTDEYWVMGYGKAQVTSLIRWYEIAIEDDTTIVSYHRSEPEDNKEMRLTAFAIRHNQTASNEDVTIRGLEEDGGANHFDRGGYLIALPTSLFADFLFEYDAGTITANGETTVQTLPASGSYTPSVDGNHIIDGMMTNAATIAGRSKLWVEDGTTEIRTGDSALTHTQNYDTTRDKEASRTFQRLNQSGAVTFNLQGDRGANSTVEHRWLIVVNLDDGVAAAAVYPPFPRRQNTLVRI